uniref:Ribosomal biogenesis protein LAS1L n=1 Tax=Anopheles minimus TaxID=112268 RepID=A0A182WC52_9DIPT
MENNTAAADIPFCNIDKKLPNQTYISAWRNKDEFQMVYEKIFKSAADDINSKQEAIQWLNMWKIRQVKGFPVCVRCTLVMLEAQVFDLREQQLGKGDSAKESRNIYSGAFMRFINYITESDGPRKKTIAESVRDIGIETYMVELRHLCAHRSVSISIDVFRRSAQYCMDWLNKAYWQRELASMESVNPWTVKYFYLAEDQLSELKLILRTYDAVSAARVRKAYTLEMAIESVGLTPEEVKLIETHAEKHRSARLRVIAKQTVQQLRDLPLPKTQSAVNALCQALFDNCKRMFHDAVQYGNDDQTPLGKMHSELFRALAAMGCVQTLFKRLIAICEQTDLMNVHEKPWAKYWAHRIAVGFQLLREYKKSCSTLPPEQVSRCGQVPRVRLAKEWYAQRLQSAVDQHLMLGLYVDCPWHLKLSRSYVLARLMAMNEYTQDIVPVLLTLQEPPLSEEQQRKIQRLTEIYYPNINIFSVTTCRKNIPKQGTTTASESNTNASKIYTAEDLKEAIAKIRNASNERTEESIPAKRAKKCGPWTEPDPTLNWGSYPLGTYRI